MLKCFIHFVLFIFVYSFLNQCRLMSVSMGNAITQLKWNISHVSRDLSDNKVCYVLILIKKY
jgi:hypothetical protein